MSKADKVQLTVIYSIVAFLAVLSLLVWSGVFGQPKYQKDEQSVPQQSSRPNWFSDELTTDYSAQNFKDILRGQESTLIGSSEASTEQSSSFDGNFTVQPGGLNLRDDLKLESDKAYWDAKFKLIDDLNYYGVDGVRQDSGSTTGIPSY